MFKRQTSTQLVIHFQAALASSGVLQPNVQYIQCQPNPHAIPGEFNAQINLQRPVSDADFCGAHLVRPKILMTDVKGEPAPDGVVENQIITQTIVTADLFTGGSMGTFQEDFQLCEADFLRMKNERNTLTTWSQHILFTSIGYGISILPKWISEIAGKPEKVSQGEWAALAICLAVSLVLFLFSKFISNEKKELLNRIDKHFKSAPKSRQFVQGKK